MLKDTSAAFYVGDDQRSEPVLTIKSYEVTPELTNFIHENKHIKVAIKLDVTETIYADVEIPNIDSANLQAALEEKLEPDLNQYKIVHTLILTKPEKTDPTWKFAVTKLNPDKKLIEFIEYLIHEFDTVTGVYLPLDSTPLNIPPLKRLNFIQRAYEAVHVLFIIAIMGITASALQKEISYLNLQKQIVAVGSELQTISNKYKEELQLQTQKVAALNNDKNLKKLYGVFKAEQYPAKVLHAVMAAKGSKMFIDRFVYSGENVITMSIQYKADKVYKYSDYFNEVDNLIGSLKHSLPYHKISFYRMPKHVYAQNIQSQIPIGIKIFGPEEVDNDR